MKPEAYQGRDSSLRTIALAVEGLAFLCFLLRVSANAGPFRNLDFESSPSFPAGDYVYPFTVYANALPGWTVHIGDSFQNGACANEFILDAPAVALMTSSGNLPPIEGQKNVYLQSAASAPSSFPDAYNINVSISQTGLVPAGAQFLRFKARNQWFSYFAVPPGPFDVQLGGQDIPLVPIRSSGGDVEYVGNVSQWAGQTVELSIRVLASTNWGNTSFPEGWALVDSITLQPGVLLNVAVTSTNTLVLSWPTNAVDSLPFVLHQRADFGGKSWEAVTNAPTYSDGTNSVTLPLLSAPCFYRLKTIP